MFLSRLRAQVAAEKARSITMQQLDAAGTEYSTNAQAAAEKTSGGTLKLENGGSAGSAAGSGGSGNEEHK